MNAVAILISRIIDFFYPPFRKYFSIEFFRYGVCGVANMALDLFLYFIFYNFVVGHELVYFTIFNYQFCLTPHIAALCIVFPITLFTGFWLNKYVTFTQSDLHSFRQFGRYFSIVIVNLLVNYFGMKLLVEVCHIYPTPSKLIIMVITVTISYFGQKYFSFRKRKN